MGLGTEKHLKLCSKPCLSATASSTFIGSLVAMTMGGSLRGYRSKKNNNQHHLTLQIKLEANKSWQVPWPCPAKSFCCFWLMLLPCFMWLLSCRVCYPSSAFPIFRIFCLQVTLPLLLRRLPQGQFFVFGVKQRFRLPMLTIYGAKVLNQMPKRQEHAPKRRTRRILNFSHIAPGP